MLMKTHVHSNASRRVWSRLRVQLGGALLFAVALPFLAVVAIDPGSSFNNHHELVVGMSVAVTISLYLLRNMSFFPGIRAGYFVLPCVMAGYAMVFSVLLFLRVDYSRAMLLGSLVAFTGWLYLTYFLSARGGGLRIAVAPFGDGLALTNVPGVEWVVLSNPVEAQGRCDALVADFRHDLPEKWESYLAESALRGIPVLHVKQLRETLTGRVEIEHLSENNFGSLVPFMAYLRLRRVLDFVTALVAAVVLSPVILITAALIKLETPGPAFFRQTRMGYRGKSFRVVKFRTMRHGLNPSDKREAAITQHRDERITPLGRFLRQTRIDELPQIYNIVRGEMSWIGPRPEAEVLSRWYETELPFYRYRHIVPPGITGWAQVNQGHVADLEQVTYKLQYDFYYIKNFSPWLDALIAAKTMLVMLTGRGSR